MFAQDREYGDKDGHTLTATGPRSDARYKATKVATEINRKCKTVGNYVHESVRVSDNEDDNETVKVWAPDGAKVEKKDCLSHHEVMTRAEIYDGDRGTKLVGHRGYFLRRWGVLLNQALINYGLHFLYSRGYDPIQPPFFMKAEYMAKTAQLEQFDEELYKVVEGKEAEDKYLIATSEQPLSSMFADEWMAPADLPIKFAGYSSCFRKEAGAHGRDAWGIYRVHQFEKIEQFLFTKPEDSWEALESMRAIAEDFYQSLKLPYRVVVIVSGALNNAAAKKYDLEAWFPHQGEYKELVSCSNCTDYQTRELEIRYGQKKGAIDSRKTYCHALNGTLCATERTLCCIVENYQTDEGIRVPDVLKPYMPAGTPDVIPYTKELPKESAKQKGKREKPSATPSAASTPAPATPSNLAPKVPAPDAEAVAGKLANAKLDEAKVDEAKVDETEGNESGDVINHQHDEESRNKHVRSAAHAFIYSSSRAPNNSSTHAPIVFMHGLFGSQRNNRTMSKLLARDLNRAVYTLDLRNHGDSPHHAEHTYTAMARDVEALIASLSLPSPLLIGHSMGAKVAMTMALRSPDDGAYAGLVPVDNAPVDAALLSSFATYVRAMKEVVDGPAAPTVQRQKDADDILSKYESDAGIRQFLLTNLVKADHGNGSKFKWRIPLRTLAKALPGLGDFPFHDPGEVRYRGPTLVVRGTKSHYVSDESLPVIGAFFPSFELIDIDCGHWVTSEKPEEFRAAVVDWVRRRVDGDP
ncbi:hypothetical protein DV737_g143, partial [Chaetothyriales sp. CBS 132003]